VENLKFLGISGSLRERSYNSALLRAAKKLLPENAEMTIFDLTPLPVYNEDVEAVGLPEPVEALRTQIETADGLIISTPEYNHSVPGGLKNAIDWASRGSPSVLNGKPLGVMSIVTGGFGGVRAQEHMIGIAAGVNMRQMVRPAVIVPRAAEKFDDDLNLTDETTRQFLRDFLTAFIGWTQKQL